MFEVNNSYNKKWSIWSTLEKLFIILSSIMRMSLVCSATVVYDEWQKGESTAAMSVTLPTVSPLLQGYQSTQCLLYWLGPPNSLRSGG